MTGCTVRFVAIRAQPRWIRFRHVSRISRWRPSASSRSASFTSRREGIRNRRTCQPPGGREVRGKIREIGFGITEAEIFEIEKNETFTVRWGDQLATMKVAVQELAFTSAGRCRRAIEQLAGLFGQNRHIVRKSKTRQCRVRAMSGRQARRDLGPRIEACQFEWRSICFMRRVQAVGYATGAGKFGRAIRSIGWLDPGGDVRTQGLPPEPRHDDTITTIFREHC